MQLHWTVCVPRWTALSALRCWPWCGTCTWPPARLCQVRLAVSCPAVQRSVADVKLAALPWTACLPCSTRACMQPCTTSLLRTPCTPGPLRRRPRPARAHAGARQHADERRRGPRAGDCQGFRAPGQHAAQGRRTRPAGAAPCVLPSMPSVPGVPPGHAGTSQVRSRRVHCCGALCSERAQHASRGPTGT